MKTRRYVGLLVSFLLAAGAAYAQLPAGSLRGTVTDPSGGVVPNAAVTASISGTFTRTVHSDGRGQYRFTDLPACAYAVKATAQGFSPWEQTAYEIPPGQSQSLDIRLALKSQRRSTPILRITPAPWCFKKKISTPCPTTGMT